MKISPLLVAVVAGGAAALYLASRARPAATANRPGFLDRAVTWGEATIGDAVKWAEPVTAQFAENASIGVRYGLGVWDWADSSPAAATFADNASAGVRVGFDFWNWLTR